MSGNFVDGPMDSCSRYPYWQLVSFVNIVPDMCMQSPWLDLTFGQIISWYSVGYSYTCSTVFDPSLFSFSCQTFNTDQDFSHLWMALSKWPAGTESDSLVLFSECNRVVEKRVVVYCHLVWRFESAGSSLSLHGKWMCRVYSYPV